MYRSRLSYNSGEHKHPPRSMGRSSSGKEVNFFKEFQVTPPRLGSRNKIPDPPWMCQFAMVRPLDASPRQATIPLDPDPTLRPTSITTQYGHSKFVYYCIRDLCIARPPTRQAHNKRRTLSIIPTRRGMR